MRKLIYLILVSCSVAGCVNHRIVNYGIASNCQFSQAETNIDCANAKLIGKWLFTNIATKGWSDGSLKTPNNTKLYIDRDKTAIVVQNNKRVATFKIKLLQHPDRNTVRYELSEVRGMVNFYLPKEGVFFICDINATFGDSEIDGVNYTINKLR